MMSLYLLLLIFIGAFNSTAFVSFWNRLFRWQDNRTDGLDVCYHGAFLFTNWLEAGATLNFYAPLYCFLATVILLCLSVYCYFKITSSKSQLLGYDCVLILLKWITKLFCILKMLPNVSCVIYGGPEVPITITKWKQLQKDKTQLQKNKQKEKIRLQKGKTQPQKEKSNNK